MEKQTGFKAFLKTPALIVALMLIIPYQTHAWGDRGHEIVGQIAEDTIKPSTRDWVRGVLGLEPLAVAAVFPDHVRSDQRFNEFAEFHYCEIPVGQTYKTRKRKIVKDCFGAIEGAIKILKSRDQKTQDKIEKQIALRYLAHVVGDIGNPLHVGNSFDRGGNLCRVKWNVSGTQQETNLHAVWDENLVQYLGQTYADPTKNKKAAVFLSDYMNTLREKYKDLLNQAGKDKYGASGTISWLEEGAALRESGIYPDDAPEMKDVAKGEEPFHRSYCETESSPGVKNKSTNEIKPAVLDRAYADKFAPVAETQMVKEGLRLAYILDSIADSVKKSKAPTLTEKQQDAILKHVQDQMRNK